MVYSGLLTKVIVHRFIVSSSAFSIELEGFTQKAVEKKLVYKFSSCKEGKFDVVVVFGGDMVIDNFNFTMDDLMRSERNMQVNNLLTL